MVNLGLNWGFMDELHIYTDKGQLGISTEPVSTSGAIFLTKPCNTLPGPTSTNRSAPSFDHVFKHSASTLRVPSAAPSGFVGSRWNHLPPP